MSQNQVSQNHTSQDLPRKETMKAVVYEGNGILRLEERPIPHIMTPRDAIVRVTLTTICSSDIHILHGAVPGPFQAPYWAMNLWGSWKRPEVR